jgi:thiamine pyrophosphokinase
MNTVIFANGEFGARNLAAKLCPEAEFIIAVDGGLRHCQSLNIQPHVLLGDLDSAEDDLVARALAAGVALQRYPKDKDKTDLELALDLACRRGAGKVSLFGSLGGRWDMSIANLFLLAAPAYNSLRITIYDEHTRIDLLRSGDQLQLKASPGSRVSLIPVGTQVEGVTLSGFQYPLTEHTISFASTLGISNVLIGDEGRVTIGTGSLLCIVNDVSESPR